MSDQNMVLDNQTCESVAYIPMQVSTPINLKPFARKLPISACICGEPEFTPTSCGTFILTQTICVRVPIEIGVKSKIGFPHGGSNKPKPTKDKPTKDKPTNDNSTKPGFNHWTKPNIIVDNNIKK